MSELTQEQASEVIANIRADNGGISKEDRDVTPARVLNALKNVRRKLAGATKILINNLYSKETRFIYELIQNAEDNSYTNAINAGDKPFLAFSVYPDRIIVDSNEDGFNENNVKAICSTGESTKANSDGYIGEKGIGFKSVFKVAQKVHIQSGPFSFSFEHAQGGDDDGLGMVTPMNEPFMELPAKSRTRMTLTLLKDLDLERVLTDFENVPDTLLLFLRKLQDLTIEIHRPGKTSTSLTYSKEEHAQNGLYVANLAKFTQGNTTAPSSQQKFYVVKRDVKDLPHDAARVDKNGKSISHATTVLAFPVDDKDVPILKQQHVFAFLPLRQAGFNFLIQSDFVTQANREDVVHTPRNEALLNGVAVAFRDAVIQFCKHAKLRYQWMRYLPSASISDQWWGELWNRISDQLRMTPILRPWSEGILYTPSQLRWLPSSYLDAIGQPLISDLAHELYLSPRYLLDDRQILKRLGLRCIGWDEAMDRLRVDHAKSTSKWRSITSDSDWRTRASDFLLQAFSADSDPCRNARTEMKKMALIPTADGRWVSPERLAVYFPGSADVPVPTDLGFNLVHMAATRNASWQRLLVQLGVVECSSDSVIASIARRYIKGAKPTITLQNSIAHSRYLYWNLPPEKLIIDLGIWWFDHKMQPAPIEEHLYFDKLKGTDSLAELFNARESDGVSLPRYDAHFLHPDYINAFDEKTSRHGRSWLSWLETKAGVRRNPGLYVRWSTRLSKEFQYIAKYRSERLLWILKAFWSIYGGQLELVEKDLRKCEVQVEGTNMTQALDKTFLPLPKLKSLVEEYCVPEFGFISISPQLHDDNAKDWRFLERLGIRIDDDVHFYVQALIKIRQASADGAQHNRQKTEDAIFQLYHQIQKRCTEDLEMVRKEFDNYSLLYIPAPEGEKVYWVSPKNCVWNGPDWLSSKWRLNVPQYRELEFFAKLSLKILDVTPSDVLNDLSEMKDLDMGDAKEAEEMYSWLSHVVQSSESIESRKELRELLRSTFEKSALVYVPHLKAWYRPSDCVWANPHVEIPEKASIAAAYDSKKTFFTKDLMVPEPSAVMYIKSLKSQAKNHPTASKIKETIKLITYLGVTATDVSELLEISIFPVTLPNGQSSFSTPSYVSGYPEFAVIDKVDHWNAFRGKVAHLDFSREEIRDTRPFLIACGLQNQFTSQLVEHVTDVECGILDDDMTKILRLKALALVRCATHYATPSQISHGEDPNSLFKRLRRATAYVSDGISQSMRIRLNGKTTEGNKDRANFHLSVSEDTLSFYLPKDEMDRAMCFERHLPRRFKEYLKITDPSAESVLGSVFRHDKPTFVTRILEDAGIADVAVDNYSDLADERIDGPRDESSREQRANKTSDEKKEDHPAKEQQDDDLSDEHQEANDLNPTWVRGPRTPSRRSGASPAPITPNQHSSLLMPTSGQFRPMASQDQDTSYERVLNNVVAIARRRAAEDKSGGEPRDSLVPVFEKLSQEVIKQGFGERSIDRDRRVGAAGELYVFEYLQSLQLAGFDMSNWKSVIRDYAAVHEDYRDITRWSGSYRDSLADIEYNDVEGQLTKFLIRKGHLAEEVWSRERPHYYFEVKATTSSNRQERFFISHAQYDHLQEMQIEEGKASSKVYIIVRIYNLGQGTATGFDVFVDPERQRQLGRLEFRADTWAVTPNWTISPRLGQVRDTPSLQREPSGGIPPIARDNNGAATSRPVNGSSKPASGHPGSDSAAPRISGNIGLSQPTTETAGTKDLPKRDDDEEQEYKDEEQVEADEEQEDDDEEQEDNDEVDDETGSPAQKLPRVRYDGDDVPLFATPTDEAESTAPKPEVELTALPTSAMQPATPLASPVTKLPVRGKKFFLKGKAVLVRLPQPDKPDADASSQPILEPIIQRVTDQLSNLTTTAPLSLPDTSLHSSASNTNGSIFASLPKSMPNPFLFVDSTKSSNNTDSQPPPANGMRLLGATNTADASSSNALGNSNVQDPLEVVNAAAANFAVTWERLFGPLKATTNNAESTKQAVQLDQTPASSGNSLSGQKPSPSGISLFDQTNSAGGPSRASTPSPFGSGTLPPSAGTGLFGQKPLPTPSTSLFGQATPSKGTDLAGQAPSSNGPSPSSSSTPSLFAQALPSGGTGLFGQTSSSSKPSLFGQAAPSTRPSLFGQASPSSGTSLFGQATTSKGTSLFGQAVSPISGTKSLFGQPTPSSGTSLFGQASSSSGINLFGQSTPATSANPAGQKLFGKSAPPEGTSLFSQVSAPTSTTLFDATRASTENSPANQRSPFARKSILDQPTTNTTANLYTFMKFSSTTSSWVPAAPSTVGAGEPPFHQEKDKYSGSGLDQFTSLTFKVPF